MPPIHTGINSIRANSARETIEICSLPPTNSSATWSIPFSAPTNATAPLTRLTNFERYGLLDDQVEFVVGWFRDSLPGAPIDRIAVLRLDGDLYESTMEALDPLYPKLAVGGYCIVDDFGTIEACASAVNDYRARHHITDEIIDVDGRGAYWRKSR